MGVISTSDGGEISLRYRMLISSVIFVSKMKILCYLLLHIISVGTALKCYHMNKKNHSILKPCSGYCSTIFATMKTGAEVGANYCVPTNECLATKQPMDIAKIGADMCRNLVRSTEGLIVRCRAAICQSNNCNDFLTRSSSRLMDCDLAQCHMESCHKTPDDVHTTQPLIHHTSGYHTEYPYTGEQTTGPYSGTLNTPLTTGKPDMTGVVSVPVTEKEEDVSVPFTENEDDVSVPVIHKEEDVSVTENNEKDLEILDELEREMEREMKLTEDELRRKQDELKTTVHAEIAASLITLTHEPGIPSTESVVVEKEEEEVITTPQDLHPTTPQDLPSTSGPPGSIVIMDEISNVVTEENNNVLDYDNGFMSDNTLEQTDVGAVKRLDDSSAAARLGACYIFLVISTVAMLLVTRH